MNAYIHDSTITCRYAASPKPKPCRRCMQWFYECSNCHTVLKPKPAIAAYFALRTVPCPPIQQQRAQGGCCSGKPA